MILTNENYFSKENQMKYFGSSQFKGFMECEAKEMAKLNGDYQEEMSIALLVGSFVDAHFEGTLDIFRAQHSEIFTQKGELKADYRHAEYIIERIERDEMFMRYMNGGTQQILTGQLFEVDWKIKIDSFHIGKALVDLKIMKDFARVWVDGQGKIPFVEAWGYDIQAAIYQAIEGNNLPFFIAGATKEKPEPDLAIISIPQEQIDMSREIIKANLPRFVQVKAGLIEPHRCEKCDYCRATKKLTQIVDYRELIA
jgi:hypothetical protein